MGAVDDVDDAVRQTCFAEQFDHADGGKRGPLGWFEDEGVAAGDGEGKHPAWYHHGEVERRNAGDDPDGVAVHGRLHIGRDVGQVAAHHQRRRPGSKLDTFDAALDFAVGLLVTLAVLLGDEGGEFFPVFNQQLLVFK